MIKIIFDKMTEYLWIREVIDCGVLSCNEKYFIVNNIPMEQKVAYKKSDNFVDDYERRVNNEIS